MVPNWCIIRSAKCNIDIWLGNYSGKTETVPDLTGQSVMGQNCRHFGAYAACNRAPVSTRRKRGWRCRMAPDRTEISGKWRAAWLLTEVSQCIIFRSFKSMAASSCSCSCSWWIRARSCWPEAQASNFLLSFTQSSWTWNGVKLYGWKHYFGEKSAGGCSSYDVIAPWPDLTGQFSVAP